MTILDFCRRHGFHAGYGVSRVSMLFLFLAVTAVVASAFDPSPKEPNQAEKRPITISDSIRMTEVADMFTPARFSPDGTKLVVVVKKGNLEQNTVDYSMLFWKTEDVFRSVTPAKLLTMSSSSNRPAIEDVVWLPDNETVAFLGEHPGELHEVYTFNTRTRTLTRATNHPTSILSYSMTTNGDRIAYTAEMPLQSLWDARARREGIVVSTQSLLNLLRGNIGGEGHSVETSLYIGAPGGVGRLLQTRDKITGGRPVVSPDGKYVVVETEVSKVPENWKDYLDPEVQRAVNVKLGPGQSTLLYRLELVDTTGESRFLLDSPLSTSWSESLWSPDSHSVVITRTFLPLEDTEREEHKVRQSNPFAVEVNTATGKIAKISQEELYGAVWEAKTDDLTAHVLRLESNTVYGQGEVVVFHKKASSWEKAEVSEGAKSRPQIVLEQDMHTPPRLFAVDPKSQRQNMLLDLNPQLDQLRLARVEEIEWKGTDQHTVRGGLYYPLDYVSSERYPLVIQTHGWSPKEFMIDGPYTSGDAAQELASHGIMVLQADDSNLHAVGTLGEAPRETATYEGAIDYLDRQGLIDRNRVGIVGFSRTCFTVKYALTHSTYHFAAATVTDGYDDGYFQYLVSFNVLPYVAEMFERTGGGHPWGEELKSWLKNTPGFNVDKVNTPLRIMPLNTDSLFMEWEWFALLTRMGKPAEMVLLQDGAHQLVRPWDRLASQEGNEDWLRFWLKGEEDPDPAKAEQYARWRKLRGSERSRY